ncbi:MAG: ribonuclease HII [Peptostreptococcaceae bacterium]|nr:ribonuclease HII [Peptostreptococcaceae bacterium]
MKIHEKEEYLKEKLIQMKTYENELYGKGIFMIAGVDEVGRGPLAGPVVAACVVLPENFSVLGIDDSKKVPEKKREALYLKILEEALAFGAGIVDNKIIDEINILEATKLAMKIAIDQVNRKLEGKLEHILIDALTLKNVKIPQTGIIKGDTKSVSIAAASIVAKVIRDKIMREYHLEYPFYAFDRNKGYGTQLHYEGLKKAGYCDIHRKTFIKQYLA